MFDELENSPRILSEAESMRALGFTEEEIRNAIEGRVNQEGPRTGSEHDASGTQAGASDHAQAGREQAQPAQGQSLELSGQTEAQARADAARRKAADRQEATGQPTKDQIDRERDAVPFALDGGQPGAAQGQQSDLLTPDGRVAQDAAPDHVADASKKIDATLTPADAQSTWAKLNIQQRRDVLSRVDLPQATKYKIGNKWQALSKPVQAELTRVMSEDQAQRAQPADAGTKQQSSQERGKSTRLAAQRPAPTSVAQAIRQQLDATGRFDAETHAAYAELVAAYYENTAKRLKLTPMELFQRYPLNITASGEIGAPSMDYFQGSDLPSVSKNSSAWKAYQSRMDTINALQDAGTTYRRSNSGNTGYFERGGEVVVEIGKSSAGIPKTKAEALTHLANEARQRLEQEAHAAELAKAKKAAAAEKNTALKAIATKIANAMQFFKKRIDTAHRNRNLSFRATDRKFNPKTDIIIHRSAAYGKKPGSFYYLPVLPVADFICLGEKTAYSILVSPA